MPGCQLVSGDARSECRGAGECESAIWPVDAARLAAGGVGSMDCGTCIVLLGGASGTSLAAVGFARSPDRNARGPLNPDAERSLCLEDWPGGGGKAGDMGT